MERKPYPNPIKIWLPSSPPLGKPCDLVVRRIVCLSAGGLSPGYEAVVDTVGLPSVGIVLPRRTEAPLGRVSLRQEKTTSKRSRFPPHQIHPSNQPCCQDLSLICARQEDPSASLKVTSFDVLTVSVSFAAVVTVILPLSITPPFI